MEFSEPLPILKNDVARLQNAVGHGVAEAIAVGIVVGEIGSSAPKQRPIARTTRLMRLAIRVEYGSSLMKLDVGAPKICGKT
jgi:hypothetical protein